MVEDATLEGEGAMQDAMVVAGDALVDGLLAGVDVEAVEEDSTWKAMALLPQLMHPQTQL
jgi:hypothetical protein